MHWLVNVKKDHLSFTALPILVPNSKPLLTQVNQPSTVQKHEQSHLLVLSRVFYTFLQLSVSRHRVNLVLNFFTLEEFLYYQKSTLNIFNEHKASMSVEVYMITLT
jgi:hypothetical protein